MSRWRRGWLSILLLSAMGQASADFHFRNWDDPDEPRWQEEEPALPDFPREENLLEFYVSATTANRFFVDARSISVGADGVVRYSLVVRTAGGSRNVSFEGIRCAATEYRLYAMGRADGTWTKARLSEWKPIENKPVNRHHAALNRDYFCPGTVLVRDAEEGRAALRRGGHPDAK